jgi:hypothetical protein
MPAIVFLFKTGAWFNSTNCFDPNGQFSTVWFGAAAQPLCIDAAACPPMWHAAQSNARSATVSSPP